jgi:uncharacterized protein (DUF1697 family)
LIALIRGINVGGTRKLPMSDLRAACASAGLGMVSTYIQSGNIVLDHADPPAAEIALEALIILRFGLKVPVVARTAEAWTALIAGCPYATEALEEPRNLHALICKRRPAAGAVDTLTARARDGEKIARCGDDLAIHFPNGVGTSHLSPTLIDRLADTSWMRR